MIDYAILIDPAARSGPPPAPAGLRLVFAAEALTVFAGPSTPITRMGEAGIILGTVFPVGMAERATGDLPAGMSAEVLASDGGLLLDSLWGGYVAAWIGPQRDGVLVLRDPSGAAPAYRIEEGGRSIVTSRLDFAMDVGFSRPFLDWGAVRQLAAYPNVRDARTGLRGVEELLPGCLLSASPDQRASVSMKWSPWRFARIDREIRDRDEAERFVREAVDIAVDGWSRVMSPTVLELSGGLDSSIIAVCLDRGTPGRLVTFVTPTAEGDERTYARAIAESVGRELLERPAAGATVDIGRTRAGLHPRPASQALLQPIEDVFAMIGGQFGAQSFISGLGGDNVFCALSTAGPAADALLAFGPGRRAMTAFLELCRRHNATVWAGAKAVGKKALTSRSRLLPRSVSGFLTSAETVPPDHPWAADADCARPGKRDHVASILVAQGYLDRYDHARVAPVLFPLLAQPVLEACLRVPTWMVNQGGRNRAVARDAFADRLPAIVRDRQTKGGLNAFMGEAFEQNRAQFAERLCRGWLASAGIVDAAAVSRFLEDPKPAGEEMTRLFYLADIESWARTWPARDGSSAVS